MMPYVRDSLFAGRDVASLAAWRAEGVRWSAEVAGRRSCRPLEGAAPMAVFEAVEADALVPLPARPFELASWSTPKVHDDCHVKVGKTLYSVPWRHIGERVDVRATPARISVYARGELVKTHVARERGRVTDFTDYPPDKVAFLQRTPTWCRTRAAGVGPACAELVEELLGVNVLHRLRSAQGVLRLAERHGPERLERACARAIEAGDPSYKTVRGILAAGSEVPAPTEATGIDTPACLHGPQGLFAPAGEGAPSEGVAS